MYTYNKYTYRYTQLDRIIKSEDAKVRFLYRNNK